MFSYQHRYHAGSFADVHKHLVLTAILSKLFDKPSPLCVLDLHAGEGLYDISSPESQKHREFKQGFKRLIGFEHPPMLINTYLDIVHRYHPLYPGSPAITAHLLRKEDRALCVEGHPQAFLSLRQHFKHHSQVHLHQRNAFEALKALVPFKEKRGLIFIDPSYEVKTEFKTMAKLLIESFNRFTQGIYALWYPLLSSEPHYPLLNTLQHSPLTKVWYSEWIPFTKKDNANLYGSGICIINMPWKMDLLLCETFEWLNKHAYQNGSFKHGWI